MLPFTANSKRPVFIVGIGARTPLGLNARSSAAAVRGAISAIREHPYMVDTAGEPMMVAIDPVLNPKYTGIERFLALASDAIQEALSPLAARRLNDLRIATVIGLPEQRPGVPHEFGAQFVQRLESEQTVLPPGSVATICAGHSGGLMAIEEAVRQIQSGEAALCLAGGVDSYMDPDTLEWLDSERQLMSAQNRSGFPPGEGAAFCLLASLETARLYRLEILAEILGAGSAYEDNRIKTDTVCTGTGLSQAISLAAAALKLPDERIDFTYCDLNGERYRSEEFTFTVLRTQAAFAEASDNLTPADCWGDTGAASGPLFASLAIAAAQRCYAKGPRSLLWTGSESGRRSAVILKADPNPNGAALCL